MLKNSTIVAHNFYLQPLSSRFKTTVPVKYHNQNKCLTMALESMLHHIVT